MPNSKSHIKTKLAHLNPWLLQVLLLAPWLMVYLFRASNHRYLLPQWDEVFLLLGYLLLLQWLWALLLSYHPLGAMRLSLYKWYRILGLLLIFTLLLGRNFGNWIPVELLLVLNVISIPLLILAVLLPIFIMIELSETQALGFRWKRFIILFIWPFSAAYIQRKFQKSKFVL